MRNMKVAELVLDYDIYPRHEGVDSQHIGYMAEALAAGATLPPIIVDTKTKRVVDGFHRVKANIRVFGEDCEIAAIEKTYKNERELLLDAIRSNAGHGRRLTTIDRTRCILLGEKIGIEVEELASAMSMTVEAIGELKTDRVGKLRIDSPVAIDNRVPLKRTIAQMAGKTLTREQLIANDKLSGMNQSFYVNQVILLIESDLLNTSDARLMERLEKLRGLLDEVLTPISA